MSCDCKYNTEQRHQELCDYLHQELWLPKNLAYGDSFHKLYESLGIISAVTQITHKYNRLVNQARELEAGRIKADTVVTEENISDTLLDLANYCVMTAMELERQNCSNCENKSES